MWSSFKISPAQIMPLVCCAIIAVFYLIVFLGPLNLAILQAVYFTVANVAPHLLVGVPLSLWFGSMLETRSAAMRIVTVALAAIPYSVVTYWLVMSLFAIGRGDWNEGFVLTPFLAGANAWQIMQGAVIWLLLYFSPLRYVARDAAALNPVQASRQEILLLRAGDELVSLSASELVAIHARGDYCQVQTRNAQYDTRRSLASLSQSLDSAGFIRVHRSCLVNVEHLIRAEPSGDGGMTLHLANGSAIRASRAGAKALRAIAI